jgi:cytoskeletal protein CcmA (bactofilin family)
MFDKLKGNDSSSDSASDPGPSQAAASPSPRVNEPTSRSSALIGPTISIKGDIAGEENLIIEGRVEGTVSLKAKDLTIGQSGRVVANVTANIVKIDGEVKGDITGVEKVIVSKTGKVRGNIVGPRVTLEDGAKFKGSIDMDPTERTAPEAPRTASKTLSSNAKPAPEQKPSAEAVSSSVK